MNFFLLIVCLIIFLNETAESKLRKCNETFDKFFKNLTYPFGLVCANISCNSSVDPTCKTGTWSKVLQWETDIFEIGFSAIAFARPREIVVTIDLNKDYFMKIQVITVKETRTVKVILNECSHTNKSCSQNKFLTHNVSNITDEETYVAIGFRKDKKINFATVSEPYNFATNLFGPDNEYNLTMPDFYFNTNDTMNITVSSSLDKNYYFDAVGIYLSTSVGGFFFDENGYILHNHFLCIYYNNSNEGEGLPYIVKEYFKNSENWRANRVNYTKEMVVPYFNERGMQFKPEQMFVKEEKNPRFDEKKMMRRGCKFIGKPESTESTTILKEKSTLTEKKVTIATTILKEKSKLTEETTLPKKEITKTTTTLKEESTLTEETTLIKDTTLTEEKVTKKATLLRETSTMTQPTEPAELKDDNKEFDGMNQLIGNAIPPGGSLPESGPKITSTEKNDEKKETTKQSGSGGGGDSSRGDRQVKMIWKKYILFLIMMNLAFQKLFKFID